MIEGLESGRWALLTKYHHATIDGASGVLMLNLLNDRTPDAPPPAGARRGLRADPERHRAAAADGWQPDPQPGEGGPGATAHGPREVAEAAGMTGVGTAVQRAGISAALAVTGLGLNTGQRRAGDTVEQVGDRTPSLRDALDVVRATSSASRMRPVARSTTW